MLFTAVLILKLVISAEAAGNHTAWHVHAAILGSRLYCGSTGRQLYGQMQPIGAAGLLSHSPKDQLRSSGGRSAAGVAQPVPWMFS